MAEDPHSRPFQFSLRTLMAAVTLIALACGAAALAVRGWNDDTAWLLVVLFACFSAPVLFCSAIGILHGHLKVWMAVGFLIGSIVAISHFIELFKRGMAVIGM
jgi:hypothetical protein